MLSDQTNKRKELPTMNSISHNIKYFPHDLNTRFHACKTYSNRKSNHYKIKDILRMYHISKASLMRWMKKFDGTKESLIDLPKTPKTQHPNSHTALEIKHIQDLLKRNPNIGLSELYGKLKHNYAYTRHPASLFRFLRKQGVYVKPEVKREKYTPKPYDTPKLPGIKMQLDVKYVPKDCYVGKTDEKFYQYTIIDEATRERFIYAYNSHDSFTTVDFVLRSIIYFGYIPEIIQTDNGFEFTNNREKSDKSLHLFDELCKELNIVHKLIKPRTPRHNGKVERSHRNDQERFYSFLSFFSLDDLNIQMKAYLKRSNNIPSSSINWMTPIEKRESLINTKHSNKSLFPIFEKTIFNSIVSHY